VGTEDWVFSKLDIPVMSKTVRRTGSAKVKLTDFPSSFKSLMSYVRGVQKLHFVCTLSKVKKKKKIKQSHYRPRRFQEVTALTLMQDSWL